MKHFTYGGSTASRTLNCPGWIKQAEGIPKQTSEFAKDGRALHECFEELILSETPAPRSYIDSIRAGVRITKHMVAERLEPAWFALQDFLHQYDIDEIASEITGEINEDIGGTPDFIATNADTVFVGDLKTGFGIQVSPEQNAQGLFYSWILSKSGEVTDMFFGKKKLAIVIIQPNNRGDDVLRVWTTGIGPTPVPMQIPA